MPKPALMTAFVLVTATLSACGRAPAARPSPPAAASAAPATAAPPEAHHHEHAPPHGGTLVELGEEFAHVEVVFDRGAGRLDVYLLDGEAEAPVRSTEPELTARVERLDIDGRPLTGVAPLTLPLVAVASPLTGETPGDASQFSGASETLAGHARLRGVIERVSVKGRSFESVAFEIMP